ncbi:hypothetical protein ACHAWF_002737 [Thalassiosira exigua]
MGNNCLLSVDGTDFLLAMSYWSGFYSHKFKKCGLRYEVGLCILTGHICWWHGPFPCGKFNDDMIFNRALARDLEEGERVEVDMGYRNSFPVTKCPPFVNDEMSARVRMRHETVNRRFKNWNILKAAYRHDFQLHQEVFGAVACLTQLALENGEPLFSVEYAS